MVTISGDPGSLRHLAVTLTTRSNASTSTGTALEGTVDKIISDNNWSGRAADTFRGAWGQDAGALSELATVMSLASGILDDLATKLEHAQTSLAAAYDVARGAHVVMVDGLPAKTQPSQHQADEGTAFNTAAQAAVDVADQAREDATNELGTLLGEVNPDADTSGYTTVGQLAGLAALLRGYYSLPSHRLDIIRDELAAAQAHRQQVRHDHKRTKGLSPAEQARVRALRKAAGAEVDRLHRVADAAEKLHAHFKGGKLVGTTVGDLLRATGGRLENLSRLGRLGESIPGLDIAAAGLATWDMAKHDHEKGWSWAHSIAVEGGANLAGLAAGTATDLIPVAGPFIAPFAAYGTAAAVSETFHEGHWTKNMTEHPVLGVAYSEWDTAKAVWNHDVVGVGKGVIEGAEHPVDAAKGLWSEAKWLVGAG